MTETKLPTNREPARKRGQKIPASEIDKLIGMRIRIARNMAGKKQDELAQYLGLTLQQTQKYENGKNKISVNILVKVAKYFQIPISYFIPSGNQAAGSTSGQTITMLEGIEQIAMHNVAEEWKSIGDSSKKIDSVESMLGEIHTQGLDGELVKVLQKILNSKK